MQIVQMGTANSLCRQAVQPWKWLSSINMVTFDLRASNRHQQGGPSISSYGNGRIFESPLAPKSWKSMILPVSQLTSAPIYCF